MLPIYRLNDVTETVEDFLPTVADAYTNLKYKLRGLLADLLQ